MGMSDHEQAFDLNKGSIKKVIILASTISFTFGLLAALSDYGEANHKLFIAGIVAYLTIMAIALPAYMNWLIKRQQ
jgi:hypothetical protein